VSLHYLINAKKHTKRHISKSIVTVLYYSTARMSLRGIIRQLKLCCTHATRCAHQ